MAWIDVNESLTDILFQKFWEVYLELEIHVFLVGMASDHVLLLTMYLKHESGKYSILILGYVC
jgi:hypothetical protein